MFHYTAEPMKRIPAIDWKAQENSPQTTILTLIDWSWSEGQCVFREGRSFKEKAPVPFVLRRHWRTLTAAFRLHAWTCAETHGAMGWQDDQREETPVLTFAFRPRALSFKTKFLPSAINNKKVSLNRHWKKSHFIISLKICVYTYIHISIFKEIFGLFLLLGQLWNKDSS